MPNLFESTYQVGDFIFVHLTKYSGNRLSNMAEVVQFGGTDEHSILFAKLANGETMLIRWNSYAHACIKLVNSRLVK